ncbi:unnamed protein product [Blepharisma stoltei]|uniref:Uncharacterized protein n=1 Tax=Blepharisma stoltei TaxID=1481888 RepID=A0AAU9IN07_9CILI|nr:unnamed protein product [Blepharisma stoltei]
MPGSTVVTAAYFGSLGLHGLIFMAWSCGGIKAQKSYILLFWLGLLQSINSMVIAIGFGWDNSYTLYNLCFARLFLITFISPAIFVILSDVLCFHAKKHKLFLLEKILSWANVGIFATVLVFAILAYFVLNCIANDNQLILAKISGIVLYLPNKPILLFYLWDIFWLSLSILFILYLRSWVACFWVLVSIVGYLIVLIISPMLPTDLSLYISCYSLSFTIFCLLVLQQRIAHRDINDNGYEVHQAQFNTIYRRVSQNNR